MSKVAVDVLPWIRSDLIEPAGDSSSKLPPDTFKNGLLHCNSPFLMQFFYRIGILIFISDSGYAAQAWT